MTDEAWAALMYPRRATGLVLYMVPTMWAGRQARRAALEAKANAVQDSKRELMMGAARADLPPREELEKLAATRIPVSCLCLAVFSFSVTLLKDFSNIPLEHTPNPQPTVYEGIPFIWGLGKPGVCSRGLLGFP